MDRVLHEAKREGSTAADTLRSLADRYLPMGPSSDADYPLYRGLQREDLDAPFSKNEGERRCALDAQTREAIMVSPIPHNVHPQHNVGRRRARAAALLKTVAGDPQSVTFVDAAQYGSSDRFVAIVVDYRGDLLNAASVRGSSPALAEQ
ncbi:hypothetical protein MTO96_047319, partial [Rhipicephalus appendiculatus]